MAEGRRDALRRVVVGLLYQAGERRGGEGSGDGASTGGDGEAASAPHAGGADDAAGGDAMEVDEKLVLGEGGGAEPVMMSEDGMQAQEPGLGDDD